MKTLFIILAVGIFSSLAAQNSCSKFYPSQEGKTLIIHQFDKRERLSTITEYTVTSANPSGLAIAMALKDDRGEPITEANFTASCSGGNTKLDPESVMSPLIQQYEGMEYSITGDDIAIPNDLTVGQELPDTNIVMIVGSGIMNLKTTVTMSERKVDRRESLTTPAGTFDCYVITYTNTTKMGVSRTMQSTQWVAEGVGMVQEETRKSNGRLVSKSVLQEVN